MIALNMIVLNEEERLGKLLAYLSHYVDEMVILVDDRTTDRSFEIARGFTDKVDRFALNMDFAAARNKCISRSSAQWILQVDADEWPQPELLQYFRDIDKANSPGVHGVISIHDNRIDGVPVPRHEREQHLRFFRSNYLYKGRLHEIPDIPWKKIVYAPTDYLILHHKTGARQEMQNKRYAQWPEQPCE